MKTVDEIQSFDDLVQYMERERADRYNRYLFWSNAYSTITFTRTSSHNAIVLNGYNINLNTLRNTNADE